MVRGKGCGVATPQSRLCRDSSPYAGEAFRTGVRIATGALRPRNDMVFLHGVRCKSGRADRGVRPYGVELQVWFTLLSCA